MTRLLNWSLIKVSPFVSRTARVGSGAGDAERVGISEIFPDDVVVGIHLDGRELPASVSSVSPLSRRLANATVLTVPPAVNVLTI